MLTVKRVGAEFLVNTETAGGQSNPTITELANGVFVVSWWDYGSNLGDNSLDSIRAQVFNAAGTKIGGELVVNTETAGGQFDPAITGLTNGGFVVSWSGGSGSSAKAQLFSADGTKIGNEFLVNTVGNGGGSPTITGLTNGGFVVSRVDVSGTLGDASGWSIKAQVFGADGTKVGSEFLVNTETYGFQRQPTVTGLTNGGFVVSWEDPNSGVSSDSSGTNIRRR